MPERIIFEAAPVGIVLTTPDRVLRRVNPAFCQMLGYEESELVGKSAYEITHPDDIDLSEEQAKIAFADGFEGSRFGKRYLHKSGAVVWTDVTVKAVDTPVDGKHYVLAIIQDVTEQHEQEERARQLTAVSRKLSSIIRSSPHFTAFVTRDGDVTYLNGAAREMLGMEAAPNGEATDLTLAQILACEAADYAAIAEAVLACEPWSGQTELRRVSGGGKTPVELSIFAIDTPSSAGKAGVAMIAQDITKRRQAESELAKRRRRLARATRLLLTAQEDERARVARELHDDVTQELALLAMDIAFLQSDPCENEDELRDRLVKLHDHVSTLGENVRRLSHQYHPSVLEHGDLPEALQSLVKDAKSLYDFDVSFIRKGEILSPSREVSTVIYRIIQEALRNVAKHAEATTASVSIESDEESVKIVVADDGRGFDMDDDAEHGLGLVSMQERAQSVDAKLRVISSPGEGTRIELRAALRQSQ